MGVGGHFWDALKPYAKYEGFDFLRDKKVAVDLSYWIVQHETAVKNSSTFVKNPHLRLTFFRTVNIFSKFGAFPVFIVDGTPSPLKSRARIARFFRSSGIDVSNLPVANEDEIPVERNGFFQKCVRECVELLDLLGMPVLKANGEAEALCAQLNSKGIVDACITSDSDAFLYGAKCVIKSVRPNSKEPFECYHMIDIEVGLGLKREHLIAISLLVGSDHNLNGVQGVGIDSALRFIKFFDEMEVLTRLREIGAGLMPPLEGGSQTSDVTTPKLKTSHCLWCGHPGSKTAHSKIGCEYCCTSQGVVCNKRPSGFQCDCASCNNERKERQHNWHVRVCKKIAKECNFPNDEIIDMYLSNRNENDAPAPCLSWGSPKTDIVVDFLTYHLPWKPSYIRKRILPMLSTILLREMAVNRTETLLHGQYVFDSIQRVKVRYGHQFYVVKWKKYFRVDSCSIYHISSEQRSLQPEEAVEEEDFNSTLDESDVPQVLVDDECCIILTDEDIDLVLKAFPDKVSSFLQQKQVVKSSKRRNRSPNEKSNTPNSKSTQLTVTEFYRSTKLLKQGKEGETSVFASENAGIGSTEEENKGPDKNLSKSLRRRLLFG